MHAMGKNGQAIHVGDELNVRYGNGTQRIRIREITSRGGLKIDRLVYAGTTAAEWRSTAGTMSATDKRIIGHAEPRVALP